MAEPIGIPPEGARRKVLSGQAVLVCAYEDEEKFNKANLEGVISLQELKTGFPSCQKSGKSSVIEPEQKKRVPPVGRKSTG